MFSLLKVIVFMPNIYLYTLMKTITFKFLSMHVLNLWPWPYWNLKKLRYERYYNSVNNIKMHIFLNPFEPDLFLQNNKQRKFNANRTTYFKSLQQSKLSYVYLEC